MLGAHPPPFQPGTLREYRAVFVTDRLENPGRPGPSNEGAAIIMGNSVPRWVTYWKTRRQTLSGRAAGDMAAYRHACLTEEASDSEDEQLH